MSFELYLLRTRFKYQETHSKDITTKKKKTKSSNNITACFLEVISFRTHVNYIFSSCFISSTCCDYFFRHPVCIYGIYLFIYLSSFIFLCRLVAKNEHPSSKCDLIYFLSNLISFSITYYNFICVGKLNNYIYPIDSYRIICLFTDSYVCAFNNDWIQLSSQTYLEDDMIRHFVSCVDIILWRHFTPGTTVLILRMDSQLEQETSSVSRRIIDTNIIILEHHIMKTLHDDSNWSFQTLIHPLNNWGNYFENTPTHIAGCIFILNSENDDDMMEEFR